MVEIEVLINELPRTVGQLKLTIGNSQDMMQQVILINNAQEQLRHLKQAIAKKLSCVTTQVNTTHAVASAAKGLVIPNILKFNPAITGNQGLISEKFGYPDTDISLITLQSKINCWLEWGDFLQAIAADILGDANLVSQINSHINHPSLSLQVLNLEKLLSEHNSLQKKLSRKQILNIYQDLSHSEDRLKTVKNTIQHSQTLLTLMIALSSFFGKAGFSIEWLDDAHSLIVSSNNHFQELTDILNECESFSSKINGFKNNITAIKQPKNQVVSRTRQKITSSSSQIFRKTLLMLCGLTALGVGGWLVKGQIIQLQETSLNLYQENMAVSNFKSALKLGMEAAAIAQNPPHALPVWKQAASKWQEAINLLQSIPEGTSVSAKAKERLIRYQQNYVAIAKRANTEKKSLVKLKAAEKLATEAKFFMETSPNSLTAWQEAKNKWQQAIKLLESIPQSSSVYRQAQATLPTYKTQYTAINAILQTRIQSVN